MAWESYRDYSNVRDRVIKVRVSADEIEQLQDAVDKFNKQSGSYVSATQSQIVRQLLEKFVKKEVLW
ncbi:MAG: hypothetical protein COB04_18745 [Gammaproteobacteria bacterium]|nr:MAG: hypothetical protein COB04_18745 [Gammaproteobacteria bacterium]